LLSDLRIDGVGVVIDQAFSPSAQAPIEEPVRVRASNSYDGIYFTDTMDLNSRLAWTLSLRFNEAHIQLNDLIGTSLDGDHSYGHLNPGTGMTFKLSPLVTTYAGYSQSNRAPTAGELSCANPQQPCLLDAFLVSDPALRQVVANTYEGGFRGRGPIGAGKLRWTFGVFRADTRDDIQLLSTAINGFGYYANSGRTMRQGIEAALDYQLASWSFKLNYSLTDARFRDALTVSSNSPSANADGDIAVQPGDHLPMIPLHRATIDLGYSPSQKLALGANLQFVDSQYLVGDESNQQPRLPPYFVTGLNGRYELAQGCHLSAQIDNLFDRRYYSYGSFTQLDGLPPRYANLSDPRTFTPAQGRSFSVGLIVSF
jgi:iron complex outermembrane receptor protein